jgi:hypothetical protein
VADFSGSARVPCASVRGRANRHVRGAHAQSFKPDLRGTLTAAMAVTLPRGGMSLVVESGKDTSTDLFVDCVDKTITGLFKR